MNSKTALVWLRRDLRLDDHSALAYAASEGFTCALAFVFDETILGKLPKNDRRVSFFHAALEEVSSGCASLGSLVVTRAGNPLKEIPELAKALGVSVVIAGRDYEPAAIARDRAVEKELAQGGIAFRLLKDNVIFESQEILNGSNAPYRVFTAYKNNWLAKVSPRDSEKRGTRLPALMPKKVLAPHMQRCGLADLGFEKQELWLQSGERAAQARLKAFAKKMGDYKTARDLPAERGTSGLSAHLRFGTISIRACVRAAAGQKGVGPQTWLSELIWRDFYFMILSQFPRVGLGKAFREEYDSISWPGKEAHFLAWKEGRTGFPIVDAAMRHFNETGWMHNRLRMVVASFLVKDLLIDWRRGEEVFARGLLDFDLAANNGGWQWSASTGCDAQPYFRIFNPYSQSRRFDPDGAFIRSQIPELKKCSPKEIHEPIGAYLDPIVNHSEQREKALALFKKAK